MPDEVKNKLDKIREAIKKIVEKAEEDGVVTEEESRILAVAQESLKEYEAMVTQALEDNIITQDERNKLIDLEEELLSDVYFTAMEDEKIDKDELLLLKTLIKAIDPKASTSWLE